MAVGNARPVRRIKLYPAFESRQELGDILNRLAWALGGLSPEDLEILLTVENGLAQEIRDWCSLSVPESCHNFLATSNLGEFCRVTQAGQVDLGVSQGQWVGLESPVRLQPGDSVQLHHYCPGDPQLVEGGNEIVIQWNIERSGGAPLANALLFDPHYRHDTEACSVASLGSRMAGRVEMRRLREESRQRYQRLVESAASRATAALFLTGPSLEAALEGDLPGNRFSIICNSLVKNSAFLERIQPDLLVFLDPAYHFGVSRYAAEFRRCAVAALHNYPQCTCLVPEAYLPLARAFLGAELQERLIGMPINSRGRFNLPSPQAFFARHTGNVLTQLMLPVGLALANQAWLVGADGRRPQDPGFWVHSGTVQMGNLMASLYAAHPSLARDEDVPGYYARHCRRVERLLCFASERFGKQVRSLTPSFIPALARRFSPASPGALNDV